MISHASEEQGEVLSISPNDGTMTDLQYFFLCIISLTSDVWFQQKPLLTFIWFKSWCVVTICTRSEPPDSTQEIKNIADLHISGNLSTLLLFFVLYTLRQYQQLDFNNSFVFRCQIKCIHYQFSPHTYTINRCSNTLRNTVPWHTRVWALLRTTEGDKIIPTTTHRREYLPCTTVSA